MITIERARQYYAGADAVHDFDHVLRVLALAERLALAEGADLEIVRAAALLHDVARGWTNGKPLGTAGDLKEEEKPPATAGDLKEEEKPPARAGGAVTATQAGRPAVMDPPPLGGGFEQKGGPPPPGGGFEQKGGPPPLGGGFEHAQAGAEFARRLLAGHPPERVEAVAQAIAAHRFRTGPAPESLEARVLYDADKLDAIGAIGVARAFAFGGHEGQRLWAEVPADYLESAATRHEHTPVHEYHLKLVKIESRLLTDSARQIARERHHFMRTFFERLDREVQGLA